MLGAKHHYLGVGYSDGTMGKVNVNEAVVKNLDASKSGLQTISVEYGGIVRQYKCIVDPRNVRDIPSSEFLPLMQQYGFDTKIVEHNITKNDVVSTFLDCYNDFLWIIKPETFFVDCEAIHYCGSPLKFVGYLNEKIAVEPDTVIGFDNSRDGRQEVTFEYAGISYKTSIEMVGVDFIINFPSIVYREPEHNADFKVLYTNGVEKNVPFGDCYIYGFDTIMNHNTLKNREQDITVKYGNKEQNLIVAMAFFNTIFFPKTLLRGDSSQSFNVQYYDGKVMPVSINKAKFSNLDLNRAGNQRFVVNYLGFSYSTETEVVDIDSVKYGSYRIVDGVRCYEYPTNHYLSDFTAYYHDGTERTVSFDNVSITGLDITRPGLQNVTVNYAGKQFTSKINVWEQPTEFDFSGLSESVLQFRNITGTFKALYKDGSSKNVDMADAYCQFYSDELGKQRAYITWHTHTQWLDVEVVANTKRPISLNLSRVPTDLLIYDHLKGNVRATYSDGSYDVFDVRHADFHLDTETIGKKKIKITWHGCSTPLTVTVKDDPAKPMVTEDCYQLESVPQLKWFIRALAAANTGGNDAVLTSKLFGSYDNANPIKIEGFSLTTTMKDITQTQLSKSARFTSAQRQLMKDAFNSGSPIYIGYVKGKNTKGEEVSLGGIVIEF